MTQLKAGVGLDDRLRRTVRLFAASMPLVLLILTMSELAQHPLSVFVACQRIGYAVFAIFVVMKLRPGAKERLILLCATSLATLALVNTLVLMAVDGGATSEHASVFSIALVSAAFVMFYPLWFTATYYTVFFSAFVVVCEVFTEDGSAVPRALRLAFVAAIGGFAGTTVLRNLARQVLRNQLSTERARIARDLHDHVGARLTGIALLAEREQRVGPPERAEVLQQIQQTIRLCIEELRDVVWALSHSRRDLRDLLATLRRRAEDLAEAARLELIVDANLDDLPPKLDASTSLALLSIVREALTNVVKHSGATKVTIRVARETRWLCLDVIDDGKGLSGAASNGRGLHNIQARAKEQRGTAAFDAVPSGGLAVHVRLPI